MFGVTSLTPTKPVRSLLDHTPSPHPSPYGRGSTPRTLADGGQVPLRFAMTTSRSAPTPSSRRSDAVVTRALAEDFFGRAGDVTSIATIPEQHARAHAIVVARAPGLFPPARRWSPRLLAPGIRIAADADACAPQPRPR